MWCQSSLGQRTNNRCEGFHNGIMHTTGIVHPNPFVTVQLLRRVDEEANSAFMKYLCGEDVRRTRTRTVNLNTKLATVIERYMKHRHVIPPKQFLDQIAIVYMESHHMEKMARRHVSLHLITLSKECLEEAMKVIAEQNNYDALDNTTNDTAFSNKTFQRRSSLTRRLTCPAYENASVSFLMSANGNQTATSHINRGVKITDGTHAQRSGRSAFARKRSRRVFARNERRGGGGAVC